MKIGADPMKTTKRSFVKYPALMGLCSVLVLSAAALAVPAKAQDDPARQLPSGFADEQVPAAFPDQATDILAPAQSSQVQTPQQQDAAQQRLQDILQGGTAVQQNGVADVSAQQPSAADTPAQPEERRLVPATAMGQTQGAVNTGNPVEDAATRAAAQQPPPSQPDILEQYTAQTQALGGNTGDALPQVNRVRLEGEGFDFAAGNVSVVDIDGSLQDQASLQQEIKTEAFDAAITGMFPLSPDQIQGLLKQYDATQKAAVSPPYDAPKPEISVQNISLDPGVMPPTIKTAVGNVTTLNILDATGAPWPVQDVTWAGDYEIVEPEEGGHIIRITPMSHFARGNIVIRLLTLKTPLTLTLETGRDVVQYRVDARVPEYGPFANTPLMQGGKSMVAGSSELTSILDGVPPNGAVKLTVAGVDGRTTAYSVGGTTYVRTPMTLLSPAWQSSVSSADGMNVYAMGHAPVLLLSDGGQFTRAVLKEKEDLLDGR